MVLVEAFPSAVVHAMVVAVVVVVVVAAEVDDDVEEEVRVEVEAVVAQGTCHFGSGYSETTHWTRVTISDWQLETSLRCCCCC